MSMAMVPEICFHEFAQDYSEVFLTFGNINI